MIGQHNLSSLAYESVFSSLGYFYQDPLVFDGSLRENLSLNAAIDDTHMKIALGKVSLGHIPLETVIGER
jgi:ABC-type bacteriocin/lantibiotic exporter with double-glycine peptidase domain